MKASEFGIIVAGPRWIGLSVMKTDDGVVFLANGRTMRSPHAHYYDIEVQIHNRITLEHQC